ncbi:hypothetical protein RND81_05G207000 [Saponaria officinalis]|uniref:Pectinesterase inhibitor domain-containing protein n=1 Tax=Saponaria officinalis TaxID=3572 RepID=A0AAW1KY67_SAPOF
MNRVIFILPLMFNLIIFQHATASDFESMPPTYPDHDTLGSNNNNPSIEKACNSALHKDSCIKTLKSQPGSGNADIKTLAFMSLNVTKTYGKTVADWVAQKVEEPELDPEIEQALTDCSDQYTDAMAQLEDSLVAFFANALNDVKTWMSTAMTNANTCEEGLKGANAGDVMGNKNAIFAQYCANTLAVVNELAKQKL